MSAIPGRGSHYTLGLKGVCETDAKTLLCLLSISHRLVSLGYDGRLWNTIEP